MPLSDSLEKQRYDTHEKWSEWRDSNSRPSGPKPDALPGCATLRRCLLIPTTAIFQAFIACKVSFIVFFADLWRCFIDQPVAAPDVHPFEHQFRQQLRHLILKHSALDPQNYARLG